MPTVKRGFTFTHDSIIDPTWKPAPGQRYADAPKARMIVTRATTETVWYGYAEAPHVTGWRMPRDRFEARFNTNN